MRISYTGCTSFTGCSTRHEPDKVQHRLLGVLLLVLEVCLTLLQELVDDEVDDSLADPPPRRCQTFPEAEDATLGVYSPDHHGETTV